MNIGVVGTGYVGVVTAACFAEFGVNVVGVDKDAGKIAQLQKGAIPFFEPGLEEMVGRNMREGRLAFTTDIKAAVEKSLAIFIAVGTPPGEGGAADLSFVREVAEAIGRYMDGYKVVVTKSTVPMGTGAKVRAWIEGAQARHGAFSVASNPEFLREGSAIEDFMRPNRVVIGADDPQAVAILKDLYNPLNLIEVPFVVTSVVSAEMIKYASNAFLAIKISYINEVAALCEAVGADVHDVARGMGLDNRIGRKFLHPGPGYGGSCFPKDTRAIVSIARQSGVSSKVVEAAIEVNEAQIGKMMDKIQAAAGGDLKGRKLAVLGLAFKPNTSDARESPAVRIVREIQGRGGVVRAFDPAAEEEAKSLVPGLETAPDAYAAAAGSDVLVIATEWNQFRNLDWNRMKATMRQPVVVDLRNVYEPASMKELGFRYTSVGR